MQQRHGLKEHRLEEVQGVIHFIQHRWLELMQFIGAPPQPNFLFKLQPQALGIFKGLQPLARALEALD